ncbi:MAG: hypothetical protein ACKOA9_09220, partial [Actinomycetota bacterium]
AGSSVPLNPHRNLAAATVDDVTYGWAAYVTRKDASSPYKVAVCVTWSVPKRGGAGTSQQQLLVAGTFWSPQGFGCLGRPSQGVGGPCSVASANIPDAAITVTVAQGGNSNSYSFALAGASSQMSYSGAAVATASFTSATLAAALTPPVIDQKTLITTDDDAATPIPISDSTGAQALSSIAEQALGSLRVEYLSGVGEASASATPVALGGTQCPMSVGLSAWVAKWINSAGAAPPCAMSAVKRDSQWIKIRYPFNSTFDGASVDFPWTLQVVIIPSLALGFDYGTSVTSSGVSLQPSAARNMAVNLLGIPSAPGLSATAYPIARLVTQDGISLTAQNTPGALDEAQSSATGLLGSTDFTATTLCSSAGSSTPAVPTASLDYTCRSTTPTKTNQWWEFTYRWDIVPGDCFPLPGCGKSLSYDAQAGTTTYLVGGPTIEASVTIQRLQCKNGQWDNAGFCKTGGGQAVSGFTTTTVTASVSLGASTVMIQALA